MQAVAATVLGLGLALAGFFIGQGFVEARQLERAVVVKGLAEREVRADVVIWPLQLSVADNDLTALVAEVERQQDVVIRFLVTNGFAREEITLKAPTIVDRQAQSYGNQAPRFRYLGRSVITLYSDNIDAALRAESQLLQLGRQGVSISQENYEYRTQYLFQGLNELKPAMIEEATANARAVAAKFAEDSGSALGKIKAARQGQFSIYDRDSNNPHIKRVRVVSTLTFYLDD
ncbi:MAG: SIMPL domain-containing protein [Pseudomonadota bacterium]